MAAASHEDGLPRINNGSDSPGETSAVNAPIKSKPRGPKRELLDDGRTSTSQSTLNLVNCILGAGVLGYPFCFRSCGLVLGTLLMVLSIAASRFSYNLLLYCSQISNKRTYEELAEQAMGKGGRQIVELCTAALNMGCIVAYLSILADVLSSVAGTIIPPGAEPSRNAYIMGVSIFGALPVALWVRDHSAIATFSMVSVGFVILFAIVVVIFAASPLPAAAAVAAPLVMWQPEGLLVAFPVIVYSFTAHPYYLGIFNNLHAATFARMTKVTNLAMGTSSSLYWIVGVCGYLTFRNRTAGDLLRNFGAANVDGLRGAYERAIKLCYGISILGSIPLVILPFYSIMAPLLLSRFEAGKGDGEGGGGKEGGGGGGVEKGAGVNGGAPLLIRRISSSGSGDTQEYPTPSDHEAASKPHQRTHVAAAAANGGGGGAGGPTGHRRSSTAGKAARTAVHEVDVVDLKLLHHGGGDGDGGVERELPFGKHALVVLVVLGTSLASAIWMPNVEFIFGLTGATASVLLSYILPPITFIRLLDLNPELLGGGKFTAIPESIKWEWVWRKRKAIALLCFGVISGVTCTDAILSAVKQEAAVVHLAQQLVAHEVVVAETAKVQQKARAAVTAVSAVEMAAKELGQASANATGTFSKLQQAAAALDAVAGQNASEANKAGAHEWGITTLVSGHKQHAAETKALVAVEAALADVKDEVKRTAVGVAGVIAQLDAAMSQLNMPGSGGGGNATGGGTAAAAATTKGSAGAGGGGGGSGVGSSSSNSTASGAKAGGGSARDRASDLAMELGKALGAFSDVAANATVAGKSLSQVRATAVSTLLALNETATVLDRVSRAVEAARRTNKHDEEVKKAAIAAMQLALNATATSALAMQLTGEALQRSATEEASELLHMLVQVSHDLEKTSHKVKVPKVKRVDASGAVFGAGNGTAASGAASSSTGSSSGGGGSAAASAGSVAGGNAASGARNSSSGGSGGTPSGGAAGGSSGAAGSGAASASTATTATTTQTTATGAAAGGEASGAVDGSGDGGGSDGQKGVVFPLERGKGSSAAVVKPPVTSDRTAEAAGQLEQVIKDLNTKITAAATSGSAAAAAASDTAIAAAVAAATAAAAAAAADGAIDASGIVLSGGDASGAASAATASAGGGSGGSAAAGGAGGTGPAPSAGTSATTSTSFSPPPATTAAGAAIAAGAAASNATAAGALVGGASTLNVSGIAAALQDAVALTMEKQDEALQEIEESLTKTNTKVAERVVDILKDISETNKGDTAKVSAIVAGTANAGGGGGSGAAAGHAVLAGGGGEAGAAGALTAAGSAAGNGESGLMGLVHQIKNDLSAGADESAVGPVVKVDGQGHLMQEGGDGDGVVGPVVKDSASAAATAAGGATGGEAGEASAVEAGSSSGTGDTSGSGGGEAGGAEAGGSGGGEAGGGGVAGGQDPRLRFVMSRRSAVAGGGGGGGGDSSSDGGAEAGAGKQKKQQHRKMGLELGMEKPAYVGSQGGSQGRQ